jgi:hypothetical protein
LAKPNKPNKPTKTVRRKRSPGYVRALKWIVAVGVVALVGYAASELGGVAYGEDAIRVVSFSDLSGGQKRQALRNANQARCTCGCGMTLAQCVATDSTCPVREGNIDKIKTMVREASSH